ncbi:unnamed protein product [Effrenium voratum]|nr:unnamed protein product [Effrenium voratum]
MAPDATSPDQERMVEDRLTAQAQLFLGASRGDVGLVRTALRRRDASPDTVAVTCKCMLHEDSCVCLGYSPLHCAAQAGSAGCVELLLNAKADSSVRCRRIRFGVLRGDEVAVVTVDQLSPLQVAVSCGHLEVTELLLSRGADVLQRAKEPPEDAVSLAAWAGQSHLHGILREAARDQAWKLAAGAGSCAARPESFCLEGSERLMQNPRLLALRNRILARQEKREERSPRREAALPDRA